MGFNCPDTLQGVLKGQLGIYPPSFIKLDINGKILDAQGVQTNLGILPQSGESIEHYVEALSFFFPLKKNVDGIEVIDLSNVEFGNQKVFNIHLLLMPTENWAVFSETTEVVAQMRTVLQKYNENQLLAPKTDATETAWSVGLLRKLGYNCFEYIEDSYFKLMGEPATWSEGVFKYLKVSSNYFELVEQHPFLEVFLSEAKTFWEKGEDDSLESGLWVEQDEEGSCYAIKAIACCALNRKLLLLGPAENSAENVQKLIQKARERSLDLEELQKTKVSLQSLIAFKNQFISIISHDLRAPIGSVITLLKLLIDGQLPKKDDARNVSDFLQNARVELEKVLAYNQKIYDWTNLELGRFNLDLEWVNLSDMLNDTINTFKAGCREKGIAIGVEIEADFMIHADKVMFNQILNNLVGNALKFTSRKGEITLKGRRCSVGLEVMVCDTGVGMELSAQSEVFSSYFTHHTWGTSGEKGSGLGLSICKKIIDVHGFRITLDSVVEKGTNVVIKLPEDSVKINDIKGMKEPRKKRFFRFF